MYKRLARTPATVADEGLRDAPGDPFDDWFFLRVFFTSVFPFFLSRDAPVDPLD